MTIRTSTNTSDNAVDFYDMIGQPRDATTVQLRSRINEMYAEAQANRDHRNLEKRRESATLLQWIPPARGILLHEGKRAKYDDFIEQNDSSIDFRTFLNDLLGENDFDFGAGESILGIRNQAPDAALEAVPEAEPAPRLSSRLDAVAAAAGEGAARASATASTSAIAATTAAINADAASFPKSSPTSSTTDDAAFSPVATSVSPTTVSPTTVSPTTVSSTPKVAANAAPLSSEASLPEAFASRAQSSTPTSRTTATATPLATASAASTPSAMGDLASSARSSSTRSAGARKVALHPDLVRERASLISSAFGSTVLFVVLLALRALLGVDSNLPALVGIALVSGFVAWRAARRILLSRISSK